MMVSVSPLRRTAPVGHASGEDSHAPAPGTAGKVVGYSTNADASSQTTVSGVTVTYDISGLAVVATMTPKTGHCTTFEASISLGAGQTAGLSSAAPPPLVEPQPGFAGGDATLTAGVDFESAADFCALFGNIDSDTSDDTTAFAIPAFGS